MKPRYFNFGGKERPFYFGFNAISLLEKYTGKPISKIGEVFTEASVNDMSMILEISMQEGARLDGKDYDIPKEKIFDYMDELGMSKVSDIMVEMMEMITPPEEEEKESEAGK